MLSWPSWLTCIAARSDLYPKVFAFASTMIALTRLVGPPFESEKPINFGPQNLKKVQIEKKNNSRKIFDLWLLRKIIF